jgi:hypothetical protein
MSALYQAFHARLPSFSPFGTKADRLTRPIVLVLVLESGRAE